MNAHTLLREQHEEIGRLYSEFLATEGDERKELADKILTELMVHAAIEEELYYPELERVTDTNTVAEYRAEHAAMKAHIVRLRGMDVDDSEYPATMSVLMDDVQEHIDKEEGTGMPQVEEVLSEDMLEDLGTRMSERAEELHGSAFKRLWASLTA